MSLDEAKQKFKQAYGAKSWYAGVGIADNSLNVYVRGAAPQLPSELEGLHGFFEGIPLICKYVGKDIVALFSV